MNEYEVWGRLYGDYGIKSDVIYNKSRNPYIREEFASNNRHDSYGDIYEEVRPINK